MFFNGNVFFFDVTSFCVCMKQHHSFDFCIVEKPPTLSRSGREGRKLYQSRKACVGSVWVEAARGPEEEPPLPAHGCSF